MTVSSLRRTAVLTTTALVALIGATATASAHVTVSPNTATQGGAATVTFTVPNEEATASTTTFEVDLPTDTPIASVQTRPVPGWTAQTTLTTLATPIKTDDGDTVTQAVTKIVWSGGKIDPGQFQEFDVALGPLPATASQVVFKALQTYSDGTVVRWIDVSEAGQPEPAHPAPVLRLTAAAAGSGSDATGAPAATTPTAAVAGTTAATSTKHDNLAIYLGVGGIVIGLGAAAVAFGAVAGLKRIRRDNSTPTS